MDGILGLTGFALFLFVVIVIAFYLLPTIIAVRRKKANSTTIILINIFLGWLLVGWIVALIMALSDDPRPTQIIVNNRVSSDRIENPVMTASVPPVQQSIPNNAPPPLPPQQPVIEAPSISVQQDKIAQLKQLKDLLDNGVLTQEEFDREKAKILS